MSTSAGPWRLYWRTLGTSVRPELFVGVSRAADSVGLTVSEWMRSAAEEKLSRETAASAPAAPRQSPVVWRSPEIGGATLIPKLEKDTA